MVRFKVYTLVELILKCPTIRISLAALCAQGVSSGEVSRLYAITIIKAQKLTADLAYTLTSWKMSEK
ncbi:MAG: hypothetical protein LBD88_04340 [Candidatus Peribacteria bacterium]|nr:hypothetical protein [Candidatus Peribacteria bacterium]